MKLFVIPPISVIVGNGCVVHAGSEYLKNLNLLHHVYIVAIDIKLLDSIAFSYGGIFAVKNQIDSL